MNCPTHRLTCASGRSFAPPRILGSGSVPSVFGLALILCLLSPVGWNASAQAAPTYDPVPGEVLVKFRPGVDVSQQRRVATFHGARIVKEEPVLGYVKLQLDSVTSPSATMSPQERAGAVQATRDAATGLELHPDVAWAEPNGFYGALTAECPQDPYLVDLPGSPDQWGVFKAGVFDLWRYGGGGDPSVTIAIVDSGIDDFNDPHPDLAANVLATGYDTVGDDLDPTDVGAFAGHGTHVAGIAAAASNSIGIAGVSYCSKILVVRALNCSASETCPGTWEDIADGVVLAALYGADVINMSLGGDTGSNLVREAIQLAIKAGSIVVVAAGNDGQPQLSYPAAYPEVIAVGATDSDDNVASFSNWGDELDVVAPGVDIYSTFPGDTWVKENGTSMAAPFVSGLAALTVAENPGISQLEMETYLRAHTVPLSGANAAKDGYGRVQFTHLVDFSDAPPPYGEASHENFAWEWLGTDASPEPSISDPMDADFVPNIGGPGRADGYDDGVFRPSVATLPILPPHISPEADFLDVQLGVCNPYGPRYDGTPGKSLHLDVWADWDSDGTFEAPAAEHVIVDRTYNPQTWPGPQFGEVIGITPVDEHIYGNPVVIRSRVAYGASAGSPNGTVATGEVEDDHFINFVEDFDIGIRVNNPGVYTVMDLWDIAPDPTPWCGNHGVGHVAATAHPAVGEPCNGAIEGIATLASPDMDWTEYTAAFISLWYCHQIFDPCDPVSLDNCRIRLDRNGVKIDLGPIPLGTGTLFFDVSDLVGTDVVRVEIIEDTDQWGHIAIDDLVIWAYDGEDPVATGDLVASRTAGSTEMNLSWTATDENLFIPSPPAESTGSSYELRYSRDPITDEGSWNRARPVRPRDILAGTVVPGAAGAGESATFRVPSTLQTYHLAQRTQDEVNNRSAISNPASDATAPTIAVAVIGQGAVSASPGDSVDVDFLIRNDGNLVDSFALTATDTAGQDILNVPGYVVLGPSASAIFTARVELSPAVADSVDTLTVTAASLSDSTVKAMGDERILIDATTDVESGPIALQTPAMRITGEHPFREVLQLAVDLPATSEASVRIYRPDGRLVRRLVDQQLEAGSHAVAWDGRDERGHPVGSGVYFVTARAGRWGDTRQILRVR